MGDGVSVRTTLRTDETCIAQCLRFSQVRFRGYRPGYSVLGTSPSRARAYCAQNSASGAFPLHLLLDRLAHELRAITLARATLADGLDELIQLLDGVLFDAHDHAGLGGAAE